VGILLPAFKRHENVVGYLLVMFSGSCLCP